ncbi:MAG: class I SAM-dependent methyltransferase [Vicinamibacteria bacterium]|nr:class I SAM-dependent methyltransferase [Vicinamibacteria bacterium]
MPETLPLTEEYCPACGGTRSRPWATMQGFELRRCLTCGTIAANVPPDRTPTGSFYDEIYREIEVVPPAVRRTLDGWVATAEPFRAIGKWLDIGFGAGALLDAATARGWQAYGTETSPVARDLARHRGWHVATTLEELGTPPDSFDVVSLVELVEHLAQPDTILRAASFYLRSGGLLFLTTPNATSLNRYLLRSNWSIVAPPDHRVLFTRQGVCSLLRRHGFVTSVVRTSGFNPADILRVASRRVQQHNRVAVARAILSSVDSSPTRRALKEGVNALLNLTRTGDTLKVWAKRMR